MTWMKGKDLRNQRGHSPYLTSVCPWGWEDRMAPLTSWLPAAFLHHGYQFTCVFCPLLCTGCQGHRDGSNLAPWPHEGNHGSMGTGGPSSWPPTNAY